MKVIRLNLTGQTFVVHVQESALATVVIEAKLRLLRMATDGHVTPRDVLVFNDLFEVSFSNDETNQGERTE